MQGVARIKGDIITFDKSALKDMSKKLVESFATGFYHRLLLMKLGAEVDAIKAGKIKAVSAKELKKALS